MSKSPIPCVTTSTKRWQKLDRHFDQALDIHIVLTVEKLRHKAEATLHVSGGNLHADDVQEDMYAAIDGLVDKLDRQGKKHKEKIKNHRQGCRGRNQRLNAPGGPSPATRSPFF